MIPIRSRSQKTQAERATPSLIALGLGSNLGLSEAILRDAIRQIYPLLDHPVVGPLLVTSPIPAADQPDYLNTVLVGGSSSNPAEFLSFAKKVEWESGRRPSPRFAARPLDIDLLVWGDRVVNSPELVIPHPRLRTRRFVLEPLAAVAPDLRVPPDGASIRDLLENLTDAQQARIVPWSVQPI